MRPMIMAGTPQRAGCCLALLLGLNLYSSLLPLRAAEPLINELGMEFITVPAGEFTMGTPDLEAAAMERPDGSPAQVRDESPPHPVRFPEAFQLGRTEVTQEQWLKVMGTGPESHWQRADWRDLPVVSVTWHGVAKFIEALIRSATGSYWANLDL
jgi:formylglycine-generating enzyme required for sulfatase activity